MSLPSLSLPQFQMGRPLVSTHALAQGGGVPSWAPGAIRALSPVAAFDFTDAERAYPEAATFSAASTRYLTGADGLPTEFAIDTPRRGPRGIRLECVARAGLFADPANPNAASWTTVTSVGAHTVLTPVGLINPIELPGSTATIRRAATWALASGDVVSMRALYKAGGGTPSPRVRTRFRSSTPAYTGIGGLLGEAESLEVNLGNPINILNEDYGDWLGLSHSFVSTVTNAAVGLGLGPYSDSGTKTIVLGALQAVKEAYPGEFILNAVNATAPDFMSFVSAEPMVGFVHTFYFNGFKGDEPEATLAKLGTDADCIELYVDTATLALKARAVVSNVATEIGTLGTLVVGNPYTAQIDCGGANWRAQMQGGAMQSVAAGGVLPALTKITWGQSESGGTSASYEDATYTYAFGQTLSDAQIAGVLAAAAVPFDLYDVDVSDQAKITFLSGKGFTFNTPTAAPYAPIRKDRNRPGYFRAEVRAGVKAPGDEARASIRCELRAVDVLPDTGWGTFAVRVMDMTHAPLTSMMMHQLKQEVPTYASGPVLRFDALSDEMRIKSNGLPAPYSADITSSVDRENGPPLVSGVWEWFLYRYLFDPDGAGELEVWRNGEKIVDRTVAGGNAIPMGYDYSSQTRDKFGLYGDETVEQMVAEFDNIAFGADLSYLLDRPYPLPPQ